MQLRTISLWIVVALPCIVLVTLAAGVAAARETGDPHWLNRSGALVSALCAAAILIQVLIEISVEHRLSAATIARTRVPTEETLIDPLSRVETRIRLARIEHRERLLVRTRLRVVLVVVGGAIVGELVHGFGDLGACMWLIHCAPHG